MEGTYMIGKWKLWCVIPGNDGGDTVITGENAGSAHKKDKQKTEN